MWEIEQLKIQIQKFKNMAKIKILHFEFEEKVSNSYKKFQHQLEFFQ